MKHWHHSQKSLQRLLLFITFLSCETLVAYDICDFTVDNICYNFIRNGQDEVAVTFREIVVGYDDEYYKSPYTGDVSIPSSVTYNNKIYKVTGVGDHAFESCTYLTSVTLPSTITSIGVDAFCDCSSLVSVSMPSSVSSIGNGAFDGCKSLTSISLPSGITKIGANSFSNCSSLATITIPNSVTSIDSYAFNGCTQLLSVDIPSNVTEIGCFAFYGCSRLNSISIPNSVKTIGDGAFSGTDWFDKRPNGVIYAGKVAYKYKGTGLGENIYILDGTCSISAAAFLNCSGILGVTIPSSVTYIGERAFRGCSLTSVNIPSSVTYIGGSAFESSSLKTVTIPGNATTMGTYIFKNCSNMTSASFGNGITNISGGTFYGCSSLTSISFPSSLINIGYEAFMYCSSLSTLSLPSNVNSIGRDAFTGTVWFNNQPNGLVYAGKVAYRWKGTMPAGTNVEIEDGTLGVAGCAFSNYSALNSVTIPQSVTCIGPSAFYGCINLNSVTVGMTTPVKIDANTFAYSPTSTLYVPAGSKTVYEADANWSNLFKTIVELEPSSSNINFADPTVKTLCVMYWDTNGDLEVDTDEAAAVTSIGTEFQDRANITSFEELEYFTSVTRIAESAFSDCTNLSSIKLPKGLMTIGSGAFMRCSSLASITIPSTVASIGNMPFAGCNSLSSIIVDDDNNVFDSREDCNAIIQTNTNTLRVGCKQTTYPESVSAIGNYAFAGCTGLTTLNLPNSVTSIGTSAYNKCSNLTSIVMPKSVTNIGSGAFSGCDKLENIVVDSENLVYDSRDNCNAIINTADNTLIAGCKVTQIPNSITIIGESAFLSCSGLTSIEIPEGVTSIKSGAFNSCGDLVSVTIPSSIISIGANAFDWCNALVTVYNYKTEPIRITSNVFPKRANATLYVPAGCKEAYEAANVWKDFKEIVEMEPEPEADTDISQMDNAIYIEPLTGCAGSTVNLQVKLKNVQAATSYGFELVLPEGMSIDVTNDGSFDEEIKLSSRHSNHTLTTNKQADGSYKVAVASLSSKSLADNDGTILNIKSHIADDMALGDYPILVQKPLIVYSDGTKPTVQDVRTRITIEDYTIGDVDGDYVVDLADAVLVINYYVGKTVSNFNAMAADVDGDGIIDLADAVKIINYYVGKIPHLSPTRITKELDPQ